MWIVDGEKYALVGLEVAFDGPPPPVHIAPNLWVLTKTTFDVPSVWRECLGSIRADRVADTNLFLVSKLASETPGVLDHENKSLQHRVQLFYVGLLLSKMFSPCRKPVMLTGARRDGEIDVRHQKDLDLPVPQIFRPPPAVVADDIVMAAELGHKLDTMEQQTVPGALWRFFRTLSIYIKARTASNIEPRTASDLLDQIHQYCRCIEGLIRPAIGKTTQQFKSRTELFIGPAHHKLIRALYGIRSDVEHLHEGRYLETFNREVRLDLVKKEAIVEYIARAALARICSQDALWQHFGNKAALSKFWALSAAKRQQIWGEPIDPMVSITDFDPKCLNDEILGARKDVGW